MLTNGRMEDLDRIEQLYKASLSLPGCTWTEDYPTREDAQNDIRLGNLWAIRDEKDEIIAALSVEEDEVRPFDFCPDKTTKSVEISRVVVDRAHQGRGLAKTMVLALEDEMRKKGVGVIRLLVSPGNKPAMATYFGAGYQKLGECDLYDTHWYACEKHIDR